MAKEFIYRGKSMDELKELSVSEFADLLPSRERRTIKRGFTDAQQKLLKKLDKKNDVETHCRDMVILPKMLGKTIRIHNGKAFVQIVIMPEMVGHRLGEYAQTRNNVKHSSPGVGATRSSSNISVK